MSAALTRWCARYVHVSAVLHLNTSALISSREYGRFRACWEGSVASGAFLDDESGGYWNISSSLPALPPASTAFSNLMSYGGSAEGREVRGSLQGVTEGKHAVSKLFPPLHFFGGRRL